MLQHHAHVSWHPPRTCPPQARLLAADWPPQLLRHAPAAPLDLEGVPVYRGLRVSMGMTGGQLLEVRPCGRSGRAEFFGPLLNQAARVASMANGGQVRWCEGGASPWPLAVAGGGGAWCQWWLLAALVAAGGCWWLLVAAGGC